MNKRGPIIIIEDDMDDKNQSSSAIGPLVKFCSTLLFPLPHFYVDKNARPFCNGLRHYNRSALFSLRLVLQGYPICGNGGGDLYWGHVDRNGCKARRYLSGSFIHVRVPHGVVYFVDYALPATEIEVCFGRLTLR